MVVALVFVVVKRNRDKDGDIDTSPGVNTDYQNIPTSHYVNAAVFDSARNDDDNIIVDNSNIDNTSTVYDRVEVTPEANSSIRYSSFSNYHALGDVCAPSDHYVNFDSASNRQQGNYVGAEVIDQFNEEQRQKTMMNEPMSYQNPHFASVDV